MSDETSTWWSKREVREVSRQVLSVLRRTLEAGTLEPEREEPGDHAMRGQGASGKEGAPACRRDKDDLPRNLKYSWYSGKAPQPEEEGVRQAGNPGPRKDRSQSLPRRANRVLRGNLRREQVQLKETGPPRRP